MPSMLTDVFKSHPISTNQIDIMSFKEVPDSYKWTPKDNLDSVTTESLAGETIRFPIIDMGDTNAAVKLVRDVCSTWGAFQIVNHGIPLRLLEDIEFLSRNLFSLPINRKMQAARPENGISGYGIARIAPFFDKLMWSEGFTVAGSPIDHFRQLWPIDHSKYCEIIEKYEEEMKRLSGKLMWLMLGSLGATKEDIKWAGCNLDFEGAHAAIQLNHYPVCPEPDRAMGLGAHTDSTLLTILYQNDTSGLQVHKEGSGWVTVPVVPGSLIVNLGDLSHILSNGRYLSALHRARVNQTRSRFSVAFLWGPPTSVEILPIPTLISPVSPPLYRSVTWKEYLVTKAKYFNKALSTIRL